MEFIGKGRAARRTYGFEEIALVPASATVDPEDVDTSWQVAGRSFALPVIAAAMDSVVDVGMAAALSKLGAMAVLNLEGIQTRYANPREVLDRLAAATPDRVVAVMQEVYREPIKDDLVGRRVSEIRSGGGVPVVSTTPAGAGRLAPVAAEAGAEILLVQSTVITEQHRSERGRALSLRELVAHTKIPVMAGNCVSYEAALQLFESGVSAVFVGVGPGAACTSRKVLGVGVPQATAIMDVAAARAEFARRTGRHVPIVADGGISVGGEIAKSIACGADAVMLGSLFARAEEAPGRGFHWGMATPHAALPRGTRIAVGSTGTLRDILFGPARVDDGSQNLIEALRTAMGMCGARSVRQMQQAEVIIAPALVTEGKTMQIAQRVGQGR
ncbi:MAG TPA: GuaB3 family IMP dehydrogenase-related protein [bacterium]|jgi:IMP dehydrogenase|nr:GuaB3 family IMP dehydrogenase-related protein [bacterium]